MLTILLMVTTSFAQETAPELNAQTLFLDNGGRWLRLRDTTAGPERTLLWQSTLSYNDRALEYVDFYEESTFLVGGVTQLDLGFSYLLGRTRLGAVLPVHLHGGGDVGSVAAGLGSVGLDAQLYLTEGKHETAIAGRLMMPNGGNASPSLTAPLSGIIDLSSGHELSGGWRAAGLLGANLIPAVALDSASWGSRLRVGAGIMKVVDERERLLAELTIESQMQQLSQLNTELLVGTSVPLGPESSYLIKPALVAGFTDEPGSPRFRVLAQAQRRPALDSDQDGILDTADACPDRPEDVDGYEDDDGCPEPTLVTLNVEDSDGVEITEGLWSVGEQEATVGASLALDAGTQTFRFQEQDTPMAVPTGPPVVLTLTIPAPRGMLFVQAVNARGEPIDGAIWAASGTTAVADQPAGQAVPVRPGTYALTATAQGYRPASDTVEVVLDGEATLVLNMLPSRAAVTSERIDIQDSVYFETARAIIKEESHSLLDEVAELLVAHPELLLVRIEGHTDSRGNDQYNLELSQKRAAAVRTYLIQAGVAAERLSAIGYGETRPLDTAETPAAWEQNRRVDFFVEQRADTPAEPAPDEGAE